jgi:hypothetical protein
MGIEPSTFQLTAQYLYQLLHRVVFKKNMKLVFRTSQ